MNKLILNTILCFCILGCKKTTTPQTANATETLPYYEDASFTPHWIKTNSEVEKNFHKIPNFSLTNQLGETVTQETFKNKIYITDFFFTSCPGICPKMTVNMAILQEAFKHDNEVMLLSHSATPKIDSVSKLKEYALEKGIIASKWHLVTGDRKQIYNLGRKHYFIEENLGKEKSEDDFLHTENFVLVDKKKHLRGIYNGLNKASINQLIEDIQILKKEP